MHKAPRNGGEDGRGLTDNSKVYPILETGTVRSSQRLDTPAQASQKRALGTGPCCSDGYLPFNPRIAKPGLFIGGKVAPQRVPPGGAM